MVVTVGAIMFIELWNKLRPISDTRKSEDDDSDTVNIVQLRIQHEIEKQNLITQLGHQKKRNAHLIDSNVNYISDLDSKSEKLTIAAAENAENHARLVDARSELKAKENTIHALQKIVDDVKKTYAEDSVQPLTDVDEEKTNL